MQNNTLEQADKIINGERQDSYGNPEDSFLKVARYWQAYLDNRNTLDPLNKQDIALMMTLFKIAREQGTGHKADNAIDACGYLAIYNDRLFPSPVEQMMLACSENEQVRALFTEVSEWQDVKTMGTKAVYPAFYSDEFSPCVRVDEVIDERQES